jgi:hypothetical protein
MNDEESLVIEEWYYDSVTRVEVIDESGRAYVKYGVQKVELSIQDDFKTLKIFISKPLEFSERDQQLFTESLIDNKDKEEEE